jgi:hypothetical protein
MGKGRRNFKSKNKFIRRVNVRNIRSRFLIVCEGEQTEPNYFRKFRVPKCVVNIKGLGQNTKSLVERTIKLAEDNSYDQVWCVYDKNSFSIQDFNESIRWAHSLGFKVAYSNEAFELWFVLHFCFLDTAQNRDSLIRILNELFPNGYEKNAPTIYDALEHLQEIAIKNAATLLDQYNPINPGRDNPSTTVHLLVQELRSNSP